MRNRPIWVIENNDRHPVRYLGDVYYGSDFQKFVLKERWNTSRLGLIENIFSRNVRKYNTKEAAEEALGWHLEALNTPGLNAGYLFHPSTKLVVRDCVLTYRHEG